VEQFKHPANDQNKTRQGEQQLTDSGKNPPRHQRAKPWSRK
jgi:hypothetical protein